LTPLISICVASTAEAVELIALGTAVGPIRRGPFSCVTSAASKMVRVDGPPDPMMMPVRGLTTSACSRPESWIACCMAM